MIWFATARSFVSPKKHLSSNFREVLRCSVSLATIFIEVSTALWKDVSVNSFLFLLSLLRPHTSLLCKIASFNIFRMDTYCATPSATSWFLSWKWSLPWLELALVKSGQVELLQGLHAAYFGFYLVPENYGLRLHLNTATFFTHLSECWLTSNKPNSKEKKDHHSKKKKKSMEIFYSVMKRCGINIFIVQVTRQKMAYIYCIL